MFAHLIHFYENQISPTTNGHAKSGVGGHSRNLTSGRTKLPYIVSAPYRCDDVNYLPVPLDPSINYSCAINFMSNSYEVKSEWAKMYISDGSPVEMGLCVKQIIQAYITNMSNTKTDVLLFVTSPDLLSSRQIVHFSNWKNFFILENSCHVDMLFD